MPEYKQPSPEAWDDELSGRDPADDAVTAMSAADTGTGDETVEYTSLDSSAIEEGEAMVSANAQETGSQGEPGNQGETGVIPQPAAADGSMAPPSLDEGSTFLADLARAMQAAAVAERARSQDEIERRRLANVEEIREHGSVEAAELDQRAEVDITGIGAWADGEMERIRLERERRIEARREQLQRHVEDHRQIVERQVEAVEEAVAAYRSELDRFFDRLDGERDPGTIARLAHTRPAFPSLEVVAGRARTAATADALADEPAPPEGSDAARPWGTEDSPLIGVMDPAAGGSTATPWMPPQPAATEPRPSAPDESTAAGGVLPRSSGALLGTVPALRPIGSWLNRERDAEEQPGRE